MDELIRIETREGQETVNARELHEFLESKQDFSTWIKARIDGFEENSDYLLHKFMEQLPSGAKHKIDYYLTIETAKHVAMMERNEQGKRIRQYFITVEKRAKEIQANPKLPPASTIRELRMSAKNGLITKGQFQKMIGAPADSHIEAQPPTGLSKQAYAVEMKVREKALCKAIAERMTPGLF